MILFRHQDLYTPMSYLVVKNALPWFNQLFNIDKKCFSKSDRIALIEEKDCSRNSHTFILAVSQDTENQLVGYICISSMKLDHCARILKFAVLPLYQGRGIGYKLLIETIKVVKSTRISHIRLHAATFRHTAIHLYKKLGFVVISHIKDYYDMEKDAYHMELALQ